MILSYFSLFSAVLATAFGQFFYKKYALTSHKAFYYATILLFLLTPIASFLALQNIPVDVVYIFTSLTIFIVLLLSKYFLAENIPFRTYTGVTLIVIGVIVYGI